MMRSAVLLAFCVAALAATSSAQCIPMMNSNTGEMFDLAQIPQAMLSLVQYNVGAPKAHSFVINFCALVSAPPAGVTPCPEAAFVTQYNEVRCEHSFDSFDDASFYRAPDVAVVQFTSQAGWTAIVRLFCDPAAGSALVPSAMMGGRYALPVNNAYSAQQTGGDTYVFEFNFNSSVICGGYVPPPVIVPATGLTGGAVFILVVLVSFTVYAILTFIYNFLQGRRGLELAPHADFWTDFAGLVKDGLLFVATCGSHRGGGSGKSVDGTSAHPTGYAAVH